MSNINIEIKSEDEVVEIESTGGVRVWNECIETYFIGLIEDEVKKGIDQQPLLPNQLGKKTKKDYSQDQVKNKYNQLRIKWKEFSKILEETGIGYNAVTYQLSADDAVWTKLYKKHKSAKTFRKKGCKHYDKLCTIFGDTTATGDALVAMSENSKKKLELLERKMSITNSTTSINESENSGNYLKGNDQDLLMECIDTLSALEGVDGASFAKATKLIHDDPLWRMIFLRLPDDRKKDFVLNI
ncbi:L10-interacting MYB domain-containing protein [Bienertia sinuspersici]